MKIAISMFAFVMISACSTSQPEATAPTSAPTEVVVTELPTTEAAPTEVANEAPAIDSATVVERFQQEGLVAKNPTPMTREDYGMAPLVGEGTRFLIPSLGSDAGGRVIVGDPADMAKLADYYISLGKESAAFFSHVLVSADGRIVVQINGSLPDKAAKHYEAVVQSL